jgi:hypothetical protein
MRDLSSDTWKCGLLLIEKPFELGDADDHKRADLDRLDAALRIS